jgi:hypothetical protein
VLRFDGRGYGCDFCGYPHAHDTLTYELHALSRDLKIKAQSVLERIKRPLSRQIFVYYPVAVRPCVSCGVNIAFGTIRCPTCGAPQEIPQRDVVPQGSSAHPGGIERNVLDYIIAHNGTISLSQAAQDLTVSPDVLQSVIERLKAAGFLNQP